MNAEPPRSTVFYANCGLYALPLLAGGFQVDGTTAVLLLLAAAHVQLERVLATEPDTTAQLLEGLRAGGLVSFLADWQYCAVCGVLMLCMLLGFISGMLVDGVECVIHRPQGWLKQAADGAGGALQRGAGASQRQLQDGVSRMQLEQRRRRGERGSEDDEDEHEERDEIAWLELDAFDRRMRQAERQKREPPPQPRQPDGGQSGGRDNRRR